MATLEDALKSLTWSKTNKVQNGNEEQAQGVVSDLLPELTLETDDKDLIKSAQRWLKEWNNFSEKINLAKRQKRNERYWEGKEDEAKRRSEEDNSPDNLIFESLETFLPMATRQNPEPIVESQLNTVESNEWNELLKEQLVAIADLVKLRLKIKQSSRNWALSLLGVVKVAWDLEKKMCVPYVIRTQKMVLDPNGTVQEGQYSGSYIGEYKEETAERLVTRFPEKAEYVRTMVEGEMGTLVRYMEWWTPEMVFWTLDKEVLGKMRNPHWDYGEEVQEKVDDFGNKVEEAIPAMNHFLTKQMPYCFLSVFNLGKQPVDETSLLEQVIPMQRRINEFNRQIERNVRQMNGSIAVSSDFFNKDQAKSAADAKRDGRPILVPGDPRAAIMDLMPPNIPSDVFGHRNDLRNEMRGIFGVTGATAQGIANEDTVRGKILVREQDASRIGGGISVYIEQFAEDIFNWLTQMIYVYFDASDVARIIGDEKAARFEELKVLVGNKQVRVKVKEGSLIPKDALTLRNQAMELAGLGKITDEELYKALDFPDPKKMAEELFMQQSGQLYGQQQAPAAPQMALPVAENQPINPLSAVPI